MLGQLAQAGCLITGDEADADVVVINTCGFLQASRDEAMAEIAEAVERKADGRLRRVVVAGCLVQRDGRAIAEAIPGVDALVGVNNRDDIVRAVMGKGGHGETGAPGTLGRGTNGRPKNGRTKGDRSSGNLPTRGRNIPLDLYLSDYHPLTQIENARLRITPRHYAYLRISEGCNQKCTFCTIPSIRGPMHSKPIPVILREARQLTADGAKELILIGQDTTSFGQDLGEGEGGGDLSTLLRSLNDEVMDARWIRLMYVYPSVFTDEMIDTIASCEKVVKYIDIPLQHIHDRVLKAMHRRISRTETERLLEKLRDRIPGVAIRTTMIVGFPGETDEEFESLVDFVRDFGFDALGVFRYSLEPETPSGRMKEQIPEAVKEKRREALMLAQQEVAFDRAKASIGRTFEIVVDGRTPEGVPVARHGGQAPDVDGVTYLPKVAVEPGAFIEVRCTSTDGYDLIARPTKVSLPVSSSM